MTAMINWAGDAAMVLVPRTAIDRLFALVGDEVPLRLLAETAPIGCGDLAIDPLARTVTRGGRSIPLHPREFDVLTCLARHRGAPVSRAALYAAVWHRRFDPGTNVVAVTVSRLRAKLDLPGLPPLLHTVSGGYALGATLAAA